MFALDHAVVTTRDLDGACEAWERAGFATTPRGFHPFGTKNNIMVLGGTFIELFAFEDRGAFDAAVAEGTMPEDLGQLTSDALETRDGPSLLAVTSADVESTLDGTDSGQILVRKPIFFKRGVTLPSGDETAAEVTVHFLASANGPGLPLFVSFQHNREALWVEDWQQHPNGATDLLGATFVASRPQAFAGYLGAVFEAVEGDEEALRCQTGDGWIDVLTPRRFAQRFGAAPEAPALGSCSFDALTIGVADLGRLTDVLAGNGIPFVRGEADSVQVGKPAGLHTVVEFVAEGA
ncbi:MAG TPA: VOC family protein [Solirubrobacterales bacterium]|jgi:hypothetical protein